MDKASFLDKFLSDSHMGALYKSMFGNIHLGAAAVGTFAFICMIIYYAWTDIVSFKTNFFNFPKISRGIVCLIFIGIYVPVMKIPIYFADMMYVGTRYDDSKKKAFEDYLQLNLKVILSESENKAISKFSGNTRDTVDRIQNIKKEMGATKGGTNLFTLKFSSIIDWVISGVCFLVTGIACCVGLLLMCYAQVLELILYGIGPLVIAFSIFPFLEDKLVNWFNVYVNIIFVPVFINILDWFVMGIHTLQSAQGMRNAASNDAITGVGHLIFQIVVLFMYTRVFWLTSLVIGNDTGGKAIEQVAAAAGGQLAASGMKAGGGAVASGVGGVASYVGRKTGATAAIKGVGSRIKKALG